MTEGGDVVVAVEDSGRFLFAESQCEVRTTPLRTYNANIGVIYIALTVITLLVAWFGSTKVGASSYDTNIYRLQGHYSPGNLVIPPASTSSMVSLTPTGTALALVGALLLGSMFHFVYALDCRRLYTLLLVDRCNGMRWAQYALIHTILAIIVAQLLGTTTFDFIVLGLLTLPTLGVLGYFGDKSYPCCPCMSNVVILGTALVFIGYWTTVITNFSYRFVDAGLSPPAYAWIALVSLLLYDIFIFVSPWIQARSKWLYVTAEIAHTIALMVISAIIVICVSWSIGEQSSSI